MGVDSTPMTCYSGHLTPHLYLTSTLSGFVELFYQAWFVALLVVIFGMPILMMLLMLMGELEGWWDERKDDDEEL